MLTQSELGLQYGVTFSTGPTVAKRNKSKVKNSWVVLLLIVNVRHNIEWLKLAHQVASDESDTHYCHTSRAAVCMRCTPRHDTSF